MKTKPIYIIDGRPIYPISGAGGGPGGGEGGTDFGGPADPTGPGGPGDHEGQGGEGGGGSPADPGPSDSSSSDSEHGSGSQRDAGEGPGIGIDTDRDSENDDGEEIAAPAAPPGMPVDDGRASRAAATANPNTTSIGGTPVALETGITNKGQFARGAGKAAVGLLGVASGTPAGIIGGGASVVAGVRDISNSIGPVPGAASVSGGNTGIHDGKGRSEGLIDADFGPGPNDPDPEGGDGVGTGVLAPAPSAEPVEDVDGAADGGHGGPSLPTLPPPPSVPAVPAPPKFPNPNNVTGGGPGMRATRERIEDARKFGRQSTLLTGGEGLPDLGPVAQPGLTAPTEPLPAQPTAAGDGPSREGTRLGRGNGAGGRDRGPDVEREEREPRRFDLKAEFDQIEASNVKQGTTGASSVSSEASSTRSPDLPDGWSLERPYATIPFDVVRDPNGKLWIRDRRTGELAENHSFLTPREGRRARRRSGR
ncbi:MAG: hypothetical protein ACREJR_12345 [Candidatus Rokuibacteriota bacterium]